jgi:hypothetical protein
MRPLPHTEKRPKKFGAGCHPKCGTSSSHEKSATRKKRTKKTVNHAGLPDLFVYRDDNTDKWFYFAEVKGPNDRIGPMQEIKSRRLDEAAGKEVSGIIKLEMTTEPFTRASSSHLHMVT